MGSSASTPAGNGAQVSTGNFSSATLAKRLEKKELEIRQLRAANKSLQGEVASLRAELKRFRGNAGHSFPVPDDGSIKSISSFASFTERNEQPKLQGNLPKVGDHVVSMWGSSKWQYFTATIVDFNSRTLKYTIEWDDGDPTGRLIDYYNLALDKVPSEDQIGVGSKVLFHQGQYRQQEVHGVTRSGGYRWHQGEITKTTKAADGTRRYQGKHTKGEGDGKWVTYKDYSENFHDYKIEDFRLPPNVFDILDSVTPESKPTHQSEADEEEEAVDVFISYTKINSPSAVKSREINASDLPPSYEQVLMEDLCDPRDIVKNLKDIGVRVYFNEKEDDSSLLETVTVLKKAKIFIACLSDEYASNDRCRMEFQYAKKTMKIPVIPIVVGTGSFQWKMTVVGLLIAGELYIHFKDRSVQGFKMNELLRSIKRHIPELQLKNVQYAATGDATMDLITTPGLTLTGAALETGKADIFFSYCWSNSYTAQKDSQVSTCVGNEWNDPRLLAERLSKATGAVTWIDIKRLESAADGMGMFEQIATAIREARAVVACVSDEYAESDNCRMELQFAASSMQKPIFVLVVGSGGTWEDTVVGKVAVLGKATIDMQGISDEKEMEQKITEIKDEIMKLDDFSISEEERKPVFGKKQVLKNLKKAKKPNKFFSRKSEVPTVEIEQTRFKAPVLGDHVVCLHQAWAYFMSTIVEFDPTDLVYTVDWDDGDSTGRVQSYKDVALDVVPDSSQIGIGSIVLFPQGSYSGTEGNNTGGSRYHQGKITAIHTDTDGVTRYDGVHTKGEADGKWVNWGGYNPSFHDLTLDGLRVSPNAMDALWACKQAFNLTDDDNY